MRGIERCRTQTLQGWKVFRAYIQLCNMTPAWPPACWLSVKPMNVCMDQHVHCAAGLSCNQVPSVTHIKGNAAKIAVCWLACCLPAVRCIRMRVHQLSTEAAKPGSGRHARDNSLKRTQHILAYICMFVIGNVLAASRASCSMREGQFAGTHDTQQAPGGGVTRWGPHSRKEGSVFWDAKVR